MSRDKSQNNVNQDGERQHEHPQGEALPHQPQQGAVPSKKEKRQGKPGQANFIPGEAPVGQTGRTKPFKPPAK